MTKPTLGVAVMQLSEQMAAPQLPETLPGITDYKNWGLSMRVCTRQAGDKQLLPAGSFGWSGSYGTHFWTDRKNQLTCIYLMNLSNAAGSDEPAAREFEQDVVSGLGI